MASEWEKVCLGDVVTILGDGLHGTPEYDENGEYYFINGNNLEKGRIVFKDNTKKVNKTEFEKYKKNLNEKTLLVSINGTIGNIAYYEGEKIVLGKSACYFNVKDGFYRKFIRYVLEGGDFQEYIKKQANGTTIKNVSLKLMREYKFKAPSYKYQKYFGDILGSLDDKIELNRQMNTTLESMAQALFKSWFVDFDPVIDNALAAGNPIPDELQAKAAARLALGEARKPLPADIQALFPSSFILTEEMGWIPEGWEVSDFSKISFINSESWSNKNVPNIIRYIDLSNAKNGRISEIIDYLPEEAPSRARRILRKDDSIIGLVRPANKSFAYIFENDLTGSTGFAVMSPKNHFYRTFIYLSLTQKNTIDYFSHIADGGAYPAIRPEVVFSFLTIKPLSVEIFKKFDDIVYPLFHKLGLNAKQSRACVKIRDTLLPKLLSGELRIPDAEKIATELL